MRFWEMMPGCLFLMRHDMGVASTSNTASNKIKRPVERYLLLAANCQHDKNRVVPISIISFWLVNLCYSTSY